MKVQVNMEDEQVKRIDSYAKQMGVSRSAWCSVMIGQALMAMDKSISVIEKMAENAQMNMDDFMKSMMDDLKEK